MSPKLVFLDAATVDLDDLDMSSLRKNGDYVAFNSSEGSEVVDRSRKAEILITNKCLLGKREFSRLPKLRLVCVAATGVNNIDLESAKRRKIAVTNVAGYSTQTVAEHTLLFLLAASHRLLDHHRGALSRDWVRSQSFALLSYPFSNLAGKTLGIIGYGTIGKRVARLARIFGMKTIIVKLPGRSYPSSPKRYPLRAFLKKSDFVSLHCPLTETTRNLVNRRFLNLMKPTTYLLNLARGPVVDEQEIALALKEKRIAGYATDVLSTEPPPPDHPFFEEGVRERILITPHIAWASRESRQRLVDEMGKNIVAFLTGKKRNRIV